MLVSIILGHVVYPRLSSSSDDHIFAAQLFGHRHAVRNVKQVLSLSCSAYSIVLFASVCWWGQCHDTATSGADSSDLRNRDNIWFVYVGELATVSRYSRFCARL